MSNKIKSADKFKDMSYETAIGKLNSLVTSLEKGELSFDETLVAYKEAFEYYNYCVEYLGEAKEKLKEMSAQITVPKAFTED